MTISRRLMRDGRFALNKNGFGHSVDFTRLLPALYRRVTKGHDNSE